MSCRVEGESLRDRSTRGRSADPGPVRWLRDVADALAYGPCPRRVHRDIKPGNVMLSDGTRSSPTSAVARAVSDASSSSGGRSPPPAWRSDAGLHGAGTGHRRPGVDHPPTCTLRAGLRDAHRRRVRQAVGPGDRRAHLTEPPVPSTRHRPDVSRPGGGRYRCLEKRPEDRGLPDELLAQIEASRPLPRTAASRPPHPRGAACVARRPARWSWSPEPWGCVSGRRTARLQWRGRIALPQIRQLARLRVVGGGPTGWPDEARGIPQDPRSPRCGRACPTP